MSGAFEKRDDKANRREERAQKELQQRKKTRVITISITVAFLLILAVSLFVNSRYVRRSVTAITIGGVDFSAAEFDYFYSRAFGAYQEAVQAEQGEFAFAYLPADDIPHSRQTYPDDSGMTWADFFVNLAIEQTTQDAKFYNAARASGYVLPEDMIEAIESQISMHRLYAEWNGHPSLDSFIQAIYMSSSMNERALRNVLEFEYTAMSFSEHMYNSFEYSPEMLAEYYFENRDNLDLFTYMFLTVRSENVLRDDYDSDDDYEEAREAALEVAREEAARIAEEAVTEEDFRDLAREYDPGQYDNTDSMFVTYPGSWLPNTYASWLQDDARQYGDVDLFDYSFGATVVFFIGRDPNEYRTVNMRQMLFSIGTLYEEMFAEGEDDPVYQEYAEQAIVEARERATDALNLLNEGVAEGRDIEEVFIELLEEHSEDMTEGGLYELITKSPAGLTREPEVEEWLFSSERQIGDVEMIRTEASGYHLVLVTGFGERYCDHLSAEAMRNKDYQEWRDSLTAPDHIKRWAFAFAQR